MFYFIADPVFAGPQKDGSVHEANESFFQFETHKLLTF